jgi:hypothetical protein
MGNHIEHAAQFALLLAKSGGSRLLSELDRRPDFPDADQDFRAQVSRRRLAAAVLGHEALDRFLKTELAQAGAAFIQVLADFRAVRVAKLSV